MFQEMQRRLTLSLVCLTMAMAASVDEWKSRSVYQIMTDRYSRSDGDLSAPCDTIAGEYCGGSWRGIINRLDYIQNMGFTAVWISPVVKNIEGDTGNRFAYHGYWTQDMYSLNENFGSAEDLKALSTELHARNMYLMVDVVVNHMAWSGTPASIQYNDLIPFNDESFYHPYCPITENSTACWLGDHIVALADLRTEDSDVRTTLENWISSLVETYGIDGLRIDAAGNIEMGFLPGFAEASTVFCTGEVYSGNVSYVCPYTEVLDSTMNYPVYFQLIKSFASSDGDMAELGGFVTSMRDSCKDTTTLGSFSETHDLPRFPSYSSDIILAQNVITFTMLADGFPIIYEGQEQHFSGGQAPLNREAVWLSSYNTSSQLYGYITGLNIIRSRAINVSSDYLDYKSFVVYNDASTIAMRKGSTGAQIVIILNNDGELGNSRSLTLLANMTGFSAGELVTDIISCMNFRVDGAGDLIFIIKHGAPMVFYAAANFVDTNICVNGKTSNPPLVVINSQLTTASPTTTSTTVPSKKSGSTIMRWEDYGKIVWLALGLALYITAA